MDTANRKAENKRQLSGMLGFIERAGNKIPHPIYMFIVFFFLTLVLSAICAAAGVKAVNPVNDKEVAAVNLLTAGGIADILKSFPSVWASFAPIGAVFIATLGLGVANGSGFLKGILSLASNFKSKFIVTMIVVLIGINGNLIGDTAFVVFPPLIAILYINLKRNPLAGLFTAYASVACGFGAALVVGNGDAMLAGMTEAAARLVDPAMVVSPASGYYFMLVSTILLSPAIAWVSIKFVEKKLDDTGMGVEFELKEEEHIKVSLSAVENKAMKSAALGLAGLVLVFVAMGFKGMPFAPPEGKSFAFSPMLRAIPAVILFVFAVPGYVYGKITGSIKEFKDIFAMMTNEIKTIASFFLICFFASQFISVFAKSNLGTIIAIKCGLFLKNSGIHGVGLFIAFVFLIAIINLFVSSMSAKWAVLSTVFVPMLLIAGITPAATQMAYRIGDSLTNNITPTFAYLGIILTYAQKYDKRAQTGTVMAYMLPFSIAFTLVWVLLLVLWTVSGLPIGPGYHVFM